MVAARTRTSTECPTSVRSHRCLCQPPNCWRCNSGARVWVRWAGYSCRLEWRWRRISLPICRAEPFRSRSRVSAFRWNSPGEPTGTCNFSEQIRFCFKWIRSTKVFKINYSLDVSWLTKRAPMLMASRKTNSLAAIAESDNMDNSILLVSLFGYRSYAFYAFVGLACALHTGIAPFSCI